MIEERHYHASVSMGKRLFVIGGYCNTSCEVFDSFSIKFTLVEADLLKFVYSWSLNYKALCLDSIILKIIENYVSSRKEILYLWLCRLWKIVYSSFLSELSYL